MNKVKIFLVLLVLFISVTAVYADGNFTSLQSEIDTSTDAIEIASDYTYDNSSDENITDGIIVNKSDFTINGNGHTVDGNGQSRIFNIRGDNITINNLHIVNGQSKIGGALIALGTLTLNNITFENNSALNMGGAIILTKDSTINDCRFIDNYAGRGSAIYLESAEVIVNRSSFTSSGEFKKGFIYGLTSSLLVDNCIFANSTAEYATAIYNDRFTVVINSNFLNLNAAQSGGAIVVKELDRFVVENCSFINVSSTKNAGAIFVDTPGFLYNDNGTIQIHETEFINCSSEFGGAIVLLSGICEITQSTFEDNHAVYDGGAIYSSYGNVFIGNSLFRGNKLTSDDNNFKHGGAIYADRNILQIINSHFFDNDLHAVYSYDSDVNITRSNFTGNGEAIHGVFLDNYYLYYNEYNNDLLVLNDTNYASIIHEDGAAIEIINNSIVVTKLPKRFNLNDFGWVSSVKDQSEMNSCWTFGTCGALESALLIKTGVEYDFSENNIQNSLLRYAKYGSKRLKEGGGVYDATNYVLSWFGMLPTYEDTYDEVGKISQLISSPDTIHVQDAIFIPARNDSLDNDNIKYALVKYGALLGFYNVQLSEPYYNINTSAQYYNESNRITHAITIVGWDDDYSKDNFLITPPGDGAWIIKNSYGIEHGDDGYDYISYYDTSFAYVPSIGYAFDNLEAYTINYQTDLGGDLTFISTNDTVNSYKNSYESIANCILSAIGTYFVKANETYTFEIHINNNLMLTQSGSSPFAGFHTIALNEEIPLREGDNFTIVMKKISVPLLQSSRQYYSNNTSFIFDNEKGVWFDLKEENATASLKAYAKDLAFYTEDLVKIYKNDSGFEAYIGTANRTVTFEINGGRYNRTTDENGVARIAINLKPGNYTIRTTFNGTTFENNIEVLSTLISSNLVKYYRNSSQFFIDLIDGKDNPLANKNIKMNINGVFYDRTTNANGTARLNINLAPGSYILTALDPVTNLQMSFNITVLPVLNASDMKMSYRDGSSFAVSLVSGNGSALVNTKVTFNINGVFYIRTTDSSGIARLNINLMPGEYIITSQYETALISNKITISG